MDKNVECLALETVYRMNAMQETGHVLGVKSAFTEKSVQISARGTVQIKIAVFQQVCAILALMDFMERSVLCLALIAVTEAHAALLMARACPVNQDFTGRHVCSIVQKNAQIKRVVLWMVPACSATLVFTELNV